MPYFLEGETDNRAPEQAFFHVIPAPMEMSVSYGSGAAKGPEAILEASTQLEAWDGQSSPMDLGIHTTGTVDCKGSPEQVLERIQSRVEQTLGQGGLPVLLGGEHTVTLGFLRALRALQEKHENFGIVQLDAHADLRDEYEGSRLSHACVMRRAVDDLGLDLFQIGVRALCREEHDYRLARGVGHLDARDLYLRGMPDALLPPDFPEHIYLSLDVDGLDPSVIRATGTPAPGGLGWHQTMSLLEMALRGRRVLGFDVVELAPQPGDHASDFAAAQLVYNVMGLVQRAG